MKIVNFYRSFSYVYNTMTYSEIATEKSLFEYPHIFQHEGRSNQSVRTRLTNTPKFPDLRLFETYVVFYLYLSLSGSDDYREDLSTMSGQTQCFEIGGGCELLASGNRDWVSSLSLLGGSCSKQFITLSSFSLDSLFFITTPEALVLIQMSSKVHIMSFMIRSFKDSCSGDYFRIALIKTG